MMMLHRSVAIAVQRRTTPSASTTLSRRWMVTKRQQRAAEQKAAAALSDASDSVSKPATPATDPPILKTPAALPTPSLIRTDLKDHREVLMEQRQEFDPNQPPPFASDESGIVGKDLTESVIDLDDLYDPRLHFNSKTFQDDYEESTPLSEEIIRRIAVSNRPITCAEFVHHALTHPFYGYYTNPTNTSHENDDDDDWDDDDDDWDKEDDDNEDASADHVIGPKGDFVTAPEVSQVFGECLTVWYITQWKETLNKPKEIQFVEVGPGKGTLIADIIRSSLNSFSDFGNSISKIHLVEQSPAMRSEQQKRLSEIDKAHWIFETKGGLNEKAENNEESDDTDTTSESDGESKSESAEKKESSTDESKPTIRVIWHDNFASVVAHTAKQETKIPSMVVCQEFVDALPINVFEKTEDGWRERLIDINHEPEKASEDTSDSPNAQNNTMVYQAAKENLKFKPDKKTRLRFVVAPGTTPALRTLLNVDNSGRRQNDDTEVGQVIEVCPEGILLVQDIKRLLSQHGGAALVVDYGQEGSGDTLRGFSNHKQVHALSLPGKVDVTADVDFEALRHAVNTPPKQSTAQTNTEMEEDPNPPQAFGPVSQGQFLASMGVMDRVTGLIEDENTTDEEAEDLYSALERLVLPEHMGERYKVMAIARKKEGIFQPAGF